MTALFIIASFISHFFRSFRVVLIAWDSKLVASVGNCATFVFAAIATKFIAMNDWTIGVLVEGVCSFVACYLSLWIYEKRNKRNEITKPNKSSSGRDAR